MNVEAVWDRMGGFELTRSRQIDLDLFCTKLLS